MSYARATVPPSLRESSSRVSSLLACCALGPPASAAQCSCRREPCTGRSAWLPLDKACLSAWIEHRSGDAAFALASASRRARTRSIGSRSTGSSLIFDHPPAVAAAPPPAPWRGPARYLVARDHRLPALRHVHLLMNVLHRDLLVSARSLALKREHALLIGG